MHASAWRFGLTAVSMLFLWAGTAQAVIVYGFPGRLTTLPVLSGGVKPGWQFMGKYGMYTGIPIGPRAWVTATHVSGATGTLSYDNAGTSSLTNYASTRVDSTISGDLVVFQLNADQPDFTQWAPVWSDTATLTDRVAAGTLDVYMFGRGTDRGTAIVNGSAQTVGWNWVDQTGNEPISYGTGKVFALVNDASSNAYLQMPFFANTATSGIFSVGDSGGAVFGFDNVENRWELIGINSAVERVYAAPNVPLENTLPAAFFDARGYYVYNSQTSQWSQITGPGPVTLSSYSTSLPQKYSVLSPYIPVPEPSAVFLAAISSAGAVLAVRRKRRQAD
jgi:hypothetical protein